MATMFPWRRAGRPMHGFGGFGKFGGYMDEFNAAIGEAEHDWPIYLDRLRSDVNAEIGPSVSLLRNVTAFFSAVDWSIQAFANYVTSAAPAFTYQIQSQHTAHLDHWLGQQLLGFTDPDAKRAIEHQRAAGWAETIFALDYDTGDDRAWCLRSTPYLGSFRPLPTTLEQALERFRWIAGPRELPIPQCTKFATDYPSWSATAEGRASIPVANRIAATLSGGDWTARTLRGGACKVWQSPGLILVFNMDQDINPGSGTYYVPISGIKVNVGMLPDEMLSMLSTYYSLTYQLMNVLGGRLSREDTDRIRRAAFGPELQGLKKYNLLRLLIMGDLSVGLGALAECGKRFGGTRVAIRTREMTSRAVLDAKSSIPAVAVVGGLGAAGLIAWLLLK
jgi:hypothetical protein